MTRYRRSLVQALAVLFLSFLPLNAQEMPSAQEESRSGEVVRLFLDCQGGSCYDMDFFRTEIQFVNWVRDRRDSDVHLLITAQSTGAGGRSHELLFMGQERFDGMVDTLKYISGYDATPDESRRGLVSIIKIGLMRFVALTSVADEIAIGMRPPELGGPGGRGGPGGPARPGGMARPEDDPWNFWVFQSSFSYHGGGESTFKILGLSGSFTASRTTEDWKASLRLRTSYNEVKYDSDDVSELSVTRSQYVTGLLVKSLTDHWTAGLRASALNSTYSNYRLKMEVAPVVEYNVFPYSESTRRALTFEYALEGSYADYVEETIYLKTDETLVAHALRVSLTQNQPWGTTRIFAGANHYLHDIDLHGAAIGGSVRVRLARGLSIRLQGSFERVQDRISVAAVYSSLDDVLLRRRQLQTDYEYFSSISFSYTFGSIFNNVVNPRLGGGGMYF